MRDFRGIEGSEGRVGRLKRGLWWVRGEMGGFRAGLKGIKVFDVCLRRLNRELRWGWGEMGGGFREGSEGNGGVWGGFVENWGGLRRFCGV